MNEKQLLPKCILKKFETNGDQIDEHDPVIVAQYFISGTPWRVYAASYDPIKQMFFGYIDGFTTDWGTFSLDEMLRSQEFGFGPVQRDLYFTPCRMSEIPSKQFHHGKPRLRS